MIRVLFSAGTAAAANGITADVDVLLDAGGAGSAGDDFTVNLTLDEGSASIQLMPPSVNLVITGIAPLVSAGVGISLPAAAYSIAGLAPAVRSVLAVRVPLGEFELVPAAPTIATGASVSPAALALGISAVAPEAVGPPTGDPDFASVSLLLPFDGTNGSTTFTDRSSASRSITAFGNAQISTAQSKFGGASGLFDGSGDYIRATASTDLQFDGDFTIELWVYPLGTADYIMCSSGTDGNTQIFRLNEGGAGTLSFFLNGFFVYTPTAAGIAANTWQHLALTRSGVSTRMFVDGQQKGTTNTSYNGTFRMDVIGTFFLSGNYFGLDFNGYIDDLRITKGVARYTANFTPPTEPFPTS
jgi:hypothetical protein